MEFMVYMLWAVIDIALEAVLLAVRKKIGDKAFRILTAIVVGVLIVIIILIMKHNGIGSEEIYDA